MSRRLEATLKRANDIVANHDLALIPLFRELENVQRLKSSKLLTAQVERELEQNSFWLFQAWKALKSQMNDLQDRAHDLQVRLAGHVQDRLIGNSKSWTLDKDDDS